MDITQIDFKLFFEEYKEIKDHLYNEHNFITEVEKRRLKAKEEGEKDGKNNSR